MASSSSTAEIPLEETLELVSLQIKKELRCLPPTHSQISIFKINNQLRMVNEKEYEPVCVAIGPYHHHNDNRLHYNEERKLRYLQRMLRRQGTRVDEYVRALGKIDIQVRQQYAEIGSLKAEDFIKMMVLDGCFIIEYFREYWRTSHLRRDDWIYYSIKRDLLLLENQLPFIVLATLFDLISNAEYCNEQYNLADLTWCFFKDLPRGMSQELTSYKHLLDLIYRGMIFHFQQRELTDDGTMTVGLSKMTHAVTELEESGIKIKLLEHSRFDAKFNGVTLEIPSIFIHDDTESLLRNVVAYEQHCRCGNDFNYVTDYVTFIDCLVNTPKDVVLLRQKGIIENNLGDDEVVSKMLNKISDCVVPSERFYYASILKAVNEQCEKKTNRWMAKFRRDYFSSPWSLISLFGAILLLVLTIAQTVYAILSFHIKH